MKKDGTRAWKSNVKNSTRVYGERANRSGRLEDSSDGSLWGDLVIRFFLLGFETLRTGVLDRLLNNRYA